MSAIRSSSPSANSAAEQAAAALTRIEEPWLPGLAFVLARSAPGWTTFDRGQSYGTARWLSFDPGGCRDVAGEAPVGDATLLVEIMPAEVADRFRHLGPARTVDANDLHLLRSATALIEMVPDLAKTVGGVVRTLHVLHAEEGYDVSHSEPTIPFSIFVSVPRSGEKDAAVRLAESIVHEAMHLQLTLVENVLPLVATNGEGYSPWQGRTRPVGGLLHGLYVFSVIVRFMDLLALSRPDMAGKAARRRKEIEEEVAELGDFSGYLTEAGVALRVACLKAVHGRQVSPLATSTLLT